ncbi:SLA class II histocompatibility antigen, DQ haplotype C beta chain-like [Corapipo altera]|uniref:SLA class II histocompatibility antigen, DQ haplotype C beta chain-like n=1 Tax=Corapipo altera TaxID=415028 RepID=UPI000FD6B325|nr:SLA class II histocompatibility antigen, DQ haplotype C beta chain-like [Corapipo altera]
MRHLWALVLLGALPTADEELSEVFQEVVKNKRHFINGTERVSYVHRQIYNREQILHFNSDVGVFVGDTSFGEIQARIWNSDQDFVEIYWAMVDTVCQPSYEVSTPFLVNRRGERGAERVPLPPALGMTLEPLKPSLGITPDPSALPVPNPMAFCPLPVHPSPSQSLPVPPSHLHPAGATELPPGRAERGFGEPWRQLGGSLGEPGWEGREAGGAWLPSEMPPDTVRSKILVGVGGFVLGLVFLVLGLGFYLREKKLSQFSENDRLLRL